MRGSALFKIVPVVMAAGVLGAGGIDSKYIVFTDKEVFENTDSMIRGKMNSSDVQAQLHVGCTYDVTAYGFRSNWLSIYRNIRSVEHVKTQTCPVNKPPVPGA